MSILRIEASAARCERKDVRRYTLTENSGSTRRTGPVWPLVLRLPEFVALSVAEEQRVARSQAVGFAIVKVRLDTRISSNRQRELFQLTCKVLRSSDVVTQTDDPAFLVMLRDTEEAEPIAERIQARLPEPGIEVTVERVIEGTPPTCLPTSRDGVHEAPDRRS